MSYTCPRCWRTSFHPDDERYGWCASCNDFTGGYGLGHERPSSRSPETEPDGTMQMQHEPEEAKTKLSQMQRDGQNHSLRELRGSGMGRKDQQEMREVQRDGMFVKPVYKPTVFRFYLGAVATGMAVGIAWTPVVLRWWPAHAYQILYSFVGVMFGLQALYLYFEFKRLRIMQAELDANWIVLKEKYPEMPWDEVKSH